MTIRGMAIVAALMTILSNPAEARHHHYRHHQIIFDGNGNDPRPHAWCGWWLRHQLGVADRAFNLARNWASYGSSSHGPAVGAIVVWPHHVGLITGRTATGFIVKSGNDGHAVRERERSIRGAIAFRWPSGMAGL